MDNVFLRGDAARPIFDSRVIGLTRIAIQGAKSGVSRVVYLEILGGLEETAQALLSQDPCNTASIVSGNSSTFGPYIIL